MPNHVHCIVQPVEQWDLEFLLGSIKKWTARLMRIWAQENEPELWCRLLSDHRAFKWQHESYDRIIRDHDELITFRNYIRTNPEKAKLPSSDFSYHQVTWF
jgi:type I restriction enzyme R subunit